MKINQKKVKIHGEHTITDMSVQDAIVWSEAESQCLLFVENVGIQWKDDS